MLFRQEKPKQISSSRINLKVKLVSKNKISVLLEKRQSTKFPTLCWKRKASEDEGWEVGSWKWDVQFSISYRLCTSSNQGVWL